MGSTNQSTAWVGPTNQSTACCSTAALLYTSTCFRKTYTINTEFVARAPLTLTSPCNVLDRHVQRFSDPRAAFQPPTCHTNRFRPTPLECRNSTMHKLQAFVVPRLYYRVTAHVLLIAHSRGTLQLPSRR